MIVLRDETFLNERALAVNKPVCPWRFYYYGVAEEGAPFRDIAVVIGRRLNEPLVAKQANHFGLLENFVLVDNPTSSTLTQERLGWRPSQPGLIADLDRPKYFEARTNVALAASVSSRAAGSAAAEPRSSGGVD